jgi:Protein of unknown function (DUF1236)
MQKACGIMAIAAIALGASQFASAQTSDQSPPTSENSPNSPRVPEHFSTTRDEVMARLEEAGFKNIQIMSESFLVRAIGPDGNPIVMVVHPDSQAIVPDAAEDRDEMDARDPGDPEALGDLSEDDDEDDAVAPTPRSGRFGRSSKLMNRAPAAESEYQSEADQSATDQSIAEQGITDQGVGQQGIPDQGIAKSDRLVGRYENSRRAQQAPSDQMENRFASESAKMRDEGMRQSADNPTTPGRPNGMMREMKENEQRPLDLTGVQRTQIWKQLGGQQASTTPAGFQPKVGATVPTSLQLRSLPNSVSSEVPQVRSYGYAMVQSQLLIVDPATKKIVSIITE